MCARYGWEAIVIPPFEIGDGLPCLVDGLVLGKVGEFLFQKSQLFGPDGTHILRLWGELDSIHKFSGVPAVSFNDGG